MVCVYTIQRLSVLKYPGILFLNYNKSTKIVMNSPFKYLISSKIELNVYKNKLCLNIFFNFWLQYEQFLSVQSSILYECVKN